MAKTNHQKEKLLVLLEMLRTESDETHPLVVPRLIEKLQACLLYTSHSGGQSPGDSGGI